jgi:hypothetical protein
MDVNTAIALLKMITIANEELGRQDSKKDRDAYIKALAKVRELKKRLATMPSLVVQAAEESIAREQAYYKKVAPPDMEEIDFEELQKVFKQYLQAKPEEIVVHLIDFHALAMRWVNNYQKSRNVERVDAVIKLIDWATQEIQKGVKAQAGQIYLNIILGTGGEVPFQAITADSLKEVQTNVKGKGQQGGLSEGHLAAIRIFTGPDYGYINPSVTGNDEWLQANKKRADTGKGFENPRDPSWGERALDRLRMIEGPTHAAFLNDALKNSPLYDGTVYRGWGIDQQELDGMRASGEYVFLTPTSTSKKQSVATSFSNTRPEKPIAVIATIEKSGGRDISKYSSAVAEDEVTVPGGTRLKVKVSDINQINPTRYEIKFTGPG